MRYKLPNLGTLVVARNGEVHPTDGFGIRYKWNVSATDTDGNTFRSWITTPDGMSEDDVFGAACDAVAHEVEKFTGDDTGNEWGTYASDVEYGMEYAACYAEHVSHYRVESFAYNPGGDTFRTIADVESYARDQWVSSQVTEGSTIDVYRNNDAEPTFRYVYGPRGGLRRENY